MTCYTVLIAFIRVVLPSARMFTFNLLFLLFTVSTAELSCNLKFAIEIEHSYAVRHGKPVNYDYIVHLMTFLDSYEGDNKRYFDKETMNDKQRMKELTEIETNLICGGFLNNPEQLDLKSLKNESIKSSKATACSLVHKTFQNCNKPLKKTNAALSQTSSASSASFQVDNMIKNLSVEVWKLILVAIFSFCVSAGTFAFFFTIVESEKEQMEISYAIKQNYANRKNWYSLEKVAEQTGKNETVVGRTEQNITNDERKEDERDCDDPNADNLSLTYIDVEDSENITMAEPGIETNTDKKDSPHRDQHQSCESSISSPTANDIETSISTNSQLSSFIEKDAVPFQTLEQSQKADSGFNFKNNVKNANPIIIAD